MTDVPNRPSDARAPRYGIVDRGYAMRLATTPPDQDGPIWMVNLMKYRAVADYAAGDDAAGDDAAGDDAAGDGADASVRTGRDADDLYTPTGPLAAVGAEIVFAGDVEQQLLGDAPVWDRVGIVRYPTRRSFIEMQSLPEFQRLHVHKDAGMQQTFVIGCHPVPSSASAVVTDDADWAGVPHPPNADDGPVMVVHVLRFAGDPTDPGAAQDVGTVHGERVAWCSEVDGTIVGDGRTWDQVRFDEFPSRRAAMAVLSEPDGLDPGRGDRGPALADAYVMIVRPAIDRLRERR